MYKETTEWIPFDINRFVKLELTSRGKMHLLAFYNIGKGGVEQIHPKFSEGIVTLPMWEMMQIFGPVRMGGVNTYFNNMIGILPEEPSDRVVLMQAFLQEHGFTATAREKKPGLSPRFRAQVEGALTRWAGSIIIPMADGETEQEALDNLARDIAGQVLIDEQFWLAKKEKTVRVPEVWKPEPLKAE